MTLLIDRLLFASVETAVLALVVLAITAAVRGCAPRLAALLWLVVLAKPLLTLTGIAVIRVPIPASAPMLRQATARDVVVTGTVTPQQQVVRTEGTNRAAILLAIWGAGAAIALARALADRWQLRRLVRASRAPSSELARLYEQLAGKPRLFVSPTLDSPAIAGAVRPVILIPAWMETRADATQLLWALRHELRHAAARDTLGIALRDLALVFFWFHPLVRLAAAKWEAATELACDRELVANDVEAVDYADALYRTLLHVRTQKRLRLAPGLFATRSKIGARIAALIERPLSSRRAGRLTIAAATLFAIAAIAVGGDAGMRSRYGRGHLEEVQDGLTVSLRYEGAIEISGPRGLVTGISAGGFVFFREEREGTIRELSLEPEDGEVVRFYRVDGKGATMDSAGHQFELRMTRWLQEQIQ